MSKLRHLRAVLLRAPERGRIVRWRANTDDLDRHGTVIKPSGAKTDHFLRNPIVAWAHDAYGGAFTKPDPANIIGRVTAITAGEHALDMDVEFAPEAVNPRAEMLFRMVKAEFLNAVSIGWRPLKWHEEDRDGATIRVYDEWELLEVSLVPIPSNPHALVLARAMAAAIPSAVTPSGAPSDGTRGAASWGRFRVIVDDVEGTAFVADEAGHVRGELERDEALRDLLRRGVVPSNVSTETADEHAPWRKPNLTDFTEEPWEDLTAADKRRIAGHYAWSPTMPPERFSDLKLPHHRPEDGAVVWAGVRAAMGALLGARGGVTIPAADRRAVHAHLAAHYRQFDREPPPLREYDDDELRTLYPDLDVRVATPTSPPDGADVEAVVAALRMAVDAARARAIIREVLDAPARTLHRRT